MFTVFPLISILVVACQSLLIFYVLPTKNKTDRLLAVFSGFMLLDAGLMLITNTEYSYKAYLSTAAPFGLIYGPLLFLFYKTTQQKRLGLKSLILHFFPAFVGVLCYIVVLASPDFRNRFLSQYLIFLYGGMCFSWILYPFLILVNKNRAALLRFGLFKYGIVLLWVLTSYVVPLLWSSWENGIKDSALTTDFVVIGVMLAAIMLAYWNLFRRTRASQDFNMSTSSDSSDTYGIPIQEETKLFPVSSLQKPSKDIPEEYKDKIVQYMLLEKYFDQSFSLKQMAQELNLSQSVASQYFMQIYPDGFVKTINQRRIEKACAILQQKEINVNMEEIAFRCGFNSRASFYRNFNLEKGCSPSVYREKTLTN